MRGLVGCVCVLASLGAPRSAPAQGLPDIAPDPVGITVTATDAPAKRSYLMPALEVIIGAIALNNVVRLAGVSWAQITPSTMARNVTHLPELDEDPWTINYLGHPWFGAALFSVGRSSGLSFWASAGYAFGGSLLWETFLETEVPSINDQITTPIGGMFIGEALHRFSRALRYAGGGRPHVLRRIGADLIDPVGAINRAAWGQAWRAEEPPATYAHLAVGYNVPSTALGGSRGEGQLHVEFVGEHGLTGDAPFTPRRPMDHFELRGAIDVNARDLDTELYVRGLMVGRGFGTSDPTPHPVRGLAGLFGAYDFNSDERTRHAALGFGPGATGELKVRATGYVQATLAGYLVPWGAAGGVGEGEEMARGYHRGPGLAALAEIKVGQRGVGELSITSRGYRIQGTLVEDVADETVFTTTAGARVTVRGHHSLGVEGAYHYRRARYEEGPRSGQLERDGTAEVRAFYAITTLAGW